MKAMKWYYILSIVLLVCTIPGISQNKDSVRTGSVSGIIKDSVYNYELQTASVAVYYFKDSVLISYGLTDLNAHFQFDNLPIGQPLLIKVFYVGYKTVVHTFQFSHPFETLNLGSILLTRSENELDEVVVKSTPPVRMNGDTLEFNASAFHLDKSAVGEDLLRKLPGVTVWADGSITVNGKQVSQVLVDGRPFFGKDPRVAIQNIGKTAIDKVQVYQRNPDINNPMDSITDINIKLKKDKNFGYFGKVSVGKGTDEKYTSDGNLNYFKPQTQLGLLGIANNINKISKDASTILNLGTFKNGGAGVDDQTNFNLSGINQTKSAGIVFQHDFRAVVDPFKKNIISANYFFNNVDNNTNKDILTIFSLLHDSLQYYHLKNSSQENKTSQKFDTHFEKNGSLYQFYLNTNAEANNQQTNQIEDARLSDRFQNVQSSNSAIYRIDNKTNHFGMEFNFKKNKNPFTQKRFPGEYELSYSINYDDYNKDQNNETKFVSINNSSQNQNFSRLYKSSGYDIKHKSLMSFGNIANWVFGFKNSIMSDLEIKLQNSIEITNHNQNDLVRNFDQSTNDYIKNQNLTAISHYNIVNENPGLRLARKIVKSFPARFQKVIKVDVLLQQQFYKLSNYSTQSIQNISYQYTRFQPTAEVNYVNYQYGEYQDMFYLKYFENSDYPNVNQLVPLVDSFNLYYIAHGNINLKPDYRRELSFSWKHTSFRMKNSFFYGIDLKGGSISNNISDSVQIDNLGRTAFYNINFGEKKYLQFAGSLNKALKFGKLHQFQLSVDPSMIIEQYPNYINGEKNISKSFSLQNGINLVYTYGNYITTSLKNNIYYYSSRQQNIQEIFFSNKLYQTSFDLTYQVNSSFKIASSINFNSNYTLLNKVDKFTIWNIYLGYRFLESKNLEVNFSALDLLKQNTGVINYGSGNKISNGFTNVLQQYFMITLSYFPRKFGKK